MSVHATSWAWKQTVKDAGAKLVLLKLADQANDKGECWPSQRRLAGECEMSRRTVQRKLEVLYKARLVSAVPRERDDGGDTSLMYRLGTGVPPVRQSDAPPGDTPDVPPASPVSHHEPSEEPTSSGEPEEGDASASRARGEIWDFLEEKFGSVGTDRRAQAYQKRNKAAADLRRLDATRDELEYAVMAWSRQFVGATLTDIALATHFPQLRPTAEPAHVEPEMTIDPDIRLGIEADSLRHSLKNGICPDCGLGGGNHVTDCPEIRETPRRAYRRFIEKVAADPTYPLDEIAAIAQTWSDLDDAERGDLLELAQRIRSDHDAQEAA